ncbi:MAG: hypothetical protein AAFY66_00320 [Pseudomonadota bacterium]
MTTEHEKAERAMQTQAAVAKPNPSDRADMAVERRALPPLPKRPKVRDLQVVETAILLIESLRPSDHARSEPPALETRDAVEAALLRALRPEGGREPLSEVERLRLDLLAHAVLLEAVRREVGEDVTQPRADRLDAVAGEIIALVASR